MFEFSKQSDKRFGSLISDLKKKSKPIGVLDTILARLALEFDGTIVTRNIKHFKLTGVAI